MLFNDTVWSRLVNAYLNAVLCHRGFPLARNSQLQHAGSVSWHHNGLRKRVSCSCPPRDFPYRVDTSQQRREPSLVTLISEDKKLVQVLGLLHCLIKSRTRKGTGIKHNHTKWPCQAKLPLFTEDLRMCYEIPMTELIEVHFKNWLKKITRNLGALFNLGMMGKDDWKEMSQLHRHIVTRFVVY